MRRDGWFAAVAVVARSAHAISIGGLLAILLFVEVHGLADSFTSDEYIDTFDLTLDRLKVGVPCCNDVGHGGRRRRKVGFGAVGVQHGIVVCEESILNLNL